MSTEEGTSLIVIKQLPEIVENLRTLRERWEQAAQDAATLVCTEESVQSMKDARARMRKEFEEADAQRKAAKVRYMAPWDQVEKVWKECVAEPFKLADGAFKNEIGAFEDKLKADCLEAIKQYYSELCTASGVDFLPLDKAMELGGIKINLSDARARTPRKLQDALAHVVSRVGCDMDQIGSLDEDIQNEVYVEFTRSLNLGTAIATVQARRRAIEAAKQGAEARAAEQERAAQVAAAAPAAIAPAVAQQTERVFDEFTFTVYGCTKSQLIKIRDFLRKEGIQYE